LSGAGFRKKSGVGTLAELISVEDLCQNYYVRSPKLFAKKDAVQAVSNVSLHINEGEALGLAGESGCGKSTLGKSILHLLKPTSGRVIFNGRDLASLNGREMRKARTEMQIIFQDPFSSLNPRMTIGEILREPMRYHGLLKGKKLEDEMLRLLELVGLEPSCATRYPHEFSGGQRQRVAIARALSVKPRFIVCDEPASALDVSIQAQILNLFNRLKTELGLTYLFISHDLGSLRYISDRIAVLYLGRIVELALTDDICGDPLHPYTKALFSAVPNAVFGEKKARIILSGEPPSPINPPSGCVFHKRCQQCQPICEKTPPDLGMLKDGHYVACHFCR
jgi:oligopeptide/dipeptide ABC transporter ATP-binding protein